MSSQSDSGDRIYDAFLQAKDRSGSDREALLAQLGPTPEELAEVRILLANLREQGAAASPTSELVGQLGLDILAGTATASETPSSIGSYRVVSRIGEGGNAPIPSMVHQCLATKAFQDDSMKQNEPTPSTAVPLSVIIQNAGAGARASREALLNAVHDC